MAVVFRDGEIPSTKTVTFLQFLRYDNSKMDIYYIGTSVLLENGPFMNLKRDFSILHNLYLQVKIVMLSLPPFALQPGEIYPCAT